MNIHKQIKSRKYIFNS